MAVAELRQEGAGHAGACGGGQEGGPKRQPCPQHMLLWPVPAEGGRDSSAPHTHEEDRTLIRGLAVTLQGHLKDNPTSPCPQPHQGCLVSSPRDKMCEVSSPVQVALYQVIYR